MWYYTIRKHRNYLKQWLVIISIVVMVVLIIAGGVHIVKDEYGETHHTKISSNEFIVVSKRMDKGLFGSVSYIIEFEWLNGINRDVNCDYGFYKTISIGDTIWIDMTVNEDYHIIDMKIKENQNETMVIDETGSKTSCASGRT